VFVAVPASTTPWYFALPAAGKNVLVPQDALQPAAGAALWQLRFVHGLEAIAGLLSVVCTLPIV
jgi:hypothetical protein